MTATATASTARPASNSPVDTDKIITDLMKADAKQGQLTATLSLALIRDDKYTFTVLSQLISAKPKVIDAVLCGLSAHYQAEDARLPKLREQVKDAKDKRNNDRALTLTYTIEDILKAQRSVRLILKTAMQVALTYRGMGYVSAEFKRNRIVFKDKDGNDAEGSAAQFARAPKTPAEVAKAKAEKEAQSGNTTTTAKTAQAAATENVATIIHRASTVLDMVTTAKDANGKPVPMASDVRDEVDALFARLARLYSKDGKLDVKAVTAKFDAINAKAAGGLSAKVQARTASV